MGSLAVTRKVRPKEDGVACEICGSSKTVRSHIIPRALFRLSARPGKAVIGNRRDGPGYQYLQSGFWDDRILCAEHESDLGAPDDYAARFCRKFVVASADGYFSATIPNPKPELLVAFASACVWRMAVSRSEGRPERMLGPYAERLRALLFDGLSFDPMLLISRSAFVSKGEAFSLGMLPYRHEELGIRFWRFVTCGLIFDLKLDNRATPPPMAILAVNNSTEILLHEDFPHEAMRTPSVAASLLRMAHVPKR